MMVGRVAQVLVLTVTLSAQFSSTWTWLWCQYQLLLYPSSFTLLLIKAQKIERSSPESFAGHKDWKMTITFFLLFLSVFIVIVSFPDYPRIH